MDVQRVIRCLPGAEIVETVDNSRWKALMRVKLGPISHVPTDVRREEVDYGAHRVRLAASGREERGRWRGERDVESSLSAGRLIARATRRR